MPGLLPALLYLGKHECSLQVFTDLTKLILIVNLISQTSKQYSDEEQFHNIVKPMRETTYR